MSFYKETLLMQLKLIFACSENFTIGLSNELPWHYKQDLLHFKKQTTQGRSNAVIMGKNTFLSLKKKALPNRYTIVLSKSLWKENFKSEECKVFPNLEQMFLFLQTHIFDNIFVIGGAKIYQCILENCIHLVDTIYMTKIKKVIDGDCFFPFEYLKEFYVHQFEKDKSEPILEYFVLKQRTTPSADKEYFKLLEDILKHGDFCKSRNDTETISKLGYKMEFSLEEGFPLLTSKKMYFGGIVKELLWFLRGQTDATILQSQNVHIWDGNTSAENLKKLGFSDRKPGDAGPIYGFQMRHFGAKYIDCDTDYKMEGFDQVNNVLYLLRNEPQSRRIILNMWDPSKIEDMVLPPCHVLYQFQVRHNKLSVVLYQRSGDVGLGVPFNIASAALMVHIFAKLTGYQVGTLHHFLGDAHIYKSHVQSLQGQLNRMPFFSPRLKIKDRQQKSVDDFEYDDFLLEGYQHADIIQMKMVV